MGAIDGWLQNLSELFAQSAWIGIGAAFLAGILTSLTPCSLSGISMVIAYVGGSCANKRKALRYSLLFALGMALAFVAIGVAAAFVGRLFLGLEVVWYSILAVVLLLMALQTFGLIKLLPDRCGYKTTSKKGAFGAFLIGILAAVFASPCSTPVLVAIVSVISVEHNILFGALYLLAYSVGHSVLIVLAGVFSGFAKELAGSEKYARFGKIINILFGVLLLFLAILLILNVIDIL